MNTLNRGFSLLEVLVAILVTAIGLLGLAATQGLSVKHSQNSVSRTTATILAAQIADSMRVNLAGKSKYLVDDIDNLDNFPNCFAQNADCNPDDIAAFDLFVWKNDIKIMLPESSASITQKAMADGTLSDDVFIVTINWKERTNSTEGEKGIKDASHTVEVFP